MRAAIPCSLLAAWLLGCGDGGQLDTSGDLVVGVRTLAPAADQARVIITSIYLDPNHLAPGPIRIAVNETPLIRRSAVTGKMVWVVPGPRTGPFDLPAGAYAFTLLDSLGAPVFESQPLDLGGGTAAEIAFHGGPQHMRSIFPAPAVLADLPAGTDLVRVLNLSDAPGHVQRCAEGACTDAGVVLERDQWHEEPLPLGQSLRLEIRREDVPPFVPVTARAEHGGHLVSGVALLAAPAPLGCYYLCDPGVVRTSYVAEADLDP